VERGFYKFQHITLSRSEPEDFDLAIKVDLPESKAAAIPPFTELREILSSHIPALDGFRGFAMVVVMVCHFCLLPPWSLLIPGDSKFITLGWPCMESFFALSGFLITGILLDSKGAEDYFSVFYIRRALRILPLYYGTLFGLFVILPLLWRLGVPRLPHGFTSEPLWYGFYLANWAALAGKRIPYLGHFWSLAVEEQFYLVWPLVVYSTRRITLAKVCVALALISLATRVGLMLCGKNDLFYWQLSVNHLDGLSLGGLAALVVRNEHWIKWLAPRLKPIAYSSAACIVMLSVVFGGFSSLGWSFVYNNLLLGILFADLIIQIVLSSRSNSRSRRFLNIGWLRSCGEYSYAMYVLHFPLFLFISRRLFPDTDRLASHPKGMLVSLGILQLVLYSAATYGLGKFSWWAFESRFNRLKKYFKPRWSGGYQRD
jgi:peptidoglycan/LPS O-acetylase OafA/YrhL